MTAHTERIGMGLGIRAYDNGLMVHKMEFWGLSGEHGMEGVFWTGWMHWHLLEPGRTISKLACLFLIALRIST